MSSASQDRQRMQCAICEAPAVFVCGKCKDGHYCSELHQRVDWPNNHRFHCIGPRHTSSSSESSLAEDDDDTPPVVVKQAVKEWDVKKTNHLRLPVDVTDLWLKTMIGEGTYGKVYIACTDAQCNNRSVVVKIQAIDSDEADRDIEQIEKETAMTHQMEYAEVGPRIFFSEILDRDVLEKVLDIDTLPEEIFSFSVMVIEQWHMDLEAAQKKHPLLFQDPETVKKVVDFMQSKLQKMHHFMVHADLFAKNVLVKFKVVNGRYRLLDLSFADFGLSVWNYQKEQVATFGTRYIEYWLRMALRDADVRENFAKWSSVLDENERGTFAALKEFEVLDSAMKEIWRKYSITEKSSGVQFNNAIAQFDATESDIYNRVQVSRKQKDAFVAAYRKRLEQNPYMVDFYLLKAFKVKYNVL